MPVIAHFTKSTAAAKINGYLGGNGTLEGLKHQLKDIGLSAEVIDRIVGELKEQAGKENKKPARGYG